MKQLLVSLEILKRQDKWLQQVKAWEWLMQQKGWVIWSTTPKVEKKMNWVTKFSTLVGTIHFIGIGGIGMSGIAEVLLTLGYSVQGR